VTRSGAGSRRRGIFIAAIVAAGCHGNRGEAPPTTPSSQASVPATPAVSSATVRLGDALVISNDSGAPLCVTGVLLLAEPLAVTEGLLYRRGNFSGTWDQLLVDALMAVKGAEVALSPGFRWGSTLLPGQTITLEDVMSQTALTYPQTTLTDMSGEALKRVLEDVCDNLFHPDPYYQQGGDMVRVGGMSYSCTPGNRIGARIGDLRVRGKPLQADKTYKVASWAPVADGAAGEPVWEVLARYLRDKKVVTPRKLELPRLIGVAGNLGAA